MLATSEVIKIFGKPGDDRNLVTIKMPYPRVIDLDERRLVMTIMDQELKTLNFLRQHNAL